jgi:hypothetical protein
MALDFGSFKEHYDVVAVLGSAFILWSSNRMITKFEQNDKDQLEAIKELAKSNSASYKELNTKIDMAIADVVKKTGEMDNKREQGFKDLYIRLEHIVEDRDKQLELIRVARDKQYGELSQAFERLKGEHKAMLCVVERRKHFIEGEYEPERKQNLLELEDDDET